MGKSTDLPKNAIDIILRHGFPNGKDENYMPKFRMKTPEVDYVMNMELTKVIRVIEVNNNY